LTKEEGYILPAEVKERLIKTDNGTFYWRTQLEVYEARGWLNFGRTSWADRKKAAEILATSHHIGFGEPIGAMDMSKPWVDGHGTHYVSEVAYFNQQCYQEAMKSIVNRLVRAIVRVVLIEDKTILYPNSGTNWRLRKKNEMRRRMLCEGLDMLVKHYMPETQRVGIVGYSKVKLI
jgi:hypothetical protein